MSIIYENLGEVATNNSVVPSGCLSFMEQSLYVAEFAEQNFNAMFESVGVEELAVYENTGSFVIYEGDTLKQFKDSAKEIFRKLWGAIKGAYEKILAYFEQKRKESVKELVKLDASVADMMDDEKNYGKTHKFDLSVSDKFAEEANKLVSEVQSEFKKVVDGNSNPEDVATQAQESKDDFEGKIVSTISGIDGVKNIAEAKKKLSDKMIGDEVEVNKAWVKNNISEMVKIVEQGTTKKDVQKSYQDEKKNIYKAIKELGSLDDSLIKVAKVEISVLKSICTCLHSCMSVKMDVCKKRYAEYRVILYKLSTLKKKATTTNESVTMQEDLVEAAFNW